MCCSLLCVLLISWPPGPTDEPQLLVAGPGVLQGWGIKPEQWWCMRITDLAAADCLHVVCLPMPMVSIAKVVVMAPTSWLGAHIITIIVP